MLFIEEVFVVQVLLPMFFQPLRRTVDFLDVSLTRIFFFSQSGSDSINNVIGLAKWSVFLR